jgi:hypothetical protein
VAFAGLALAVACFHAIRLHAGRRAGRTGLRADQVNAHLEILARFDQRSAS